MIELTLQQARYLQILSLGLGHPVIQPVTREALLDQIRRLGVLQIDTIHIVARSHYFVLWSRLGAYPQHWLDDLLADKQLFEYWAHAACFIPIEDYPLYRWRMDATQRQWTDPNAWLCRNAEFTRRILEHIHENGAVRSSDFVPESGIRGTWWSWKAEKSALEQLFDLGDVMIARREKFQRVYDLADRLHPGIKEWPAFTVEEARKVFAERTVKSLGVAFPQWIADYFRIRKPGLDRLMRELVEREMIMPVKVEGFESSGYIHTASLQLLEEISSGRIAATTTHILSPFDPLVWDRARLNGLFGMDFRVECYTVAEKRKYGYWLLPILHRDEIIGRMDVKANRQRKVFEVKGLFLEDGISVTDDLLDELGKTLTACAAWHQTPQVEISNCPNVRLKSGLESQIAKLI